MVRICNISECVNKEVARGWCSKHYWRWQKYGSPDYPVKEYERHGSYDERLYSVWMAMKARTSNPSHKVYHHYGGRGIKVCFAWRTSYVRFKNDVGERPDKGYSLDRINNNGHYSCGACEECLDNHWPMNIRWADNVTQSINTRIHKTNTSGFRGVSFQHGKYRAHISVNNKQIHLGRFDSPEEAARAYNDGVLKYRGNKGQLNEV